MNEDIENIEEEDFAAMLEDSFRESKDDFIEGYIAQILDEKVLVDVGRKVEGELCKSEIIGENGELKYNVGDKISVVITGYNREQPKISHKAALAKKIKKDFIDKYKDDFEDLVVTGKVVHKNKGGYILVADEVEFFLPRSQAMLNSQNNHIGKIVDARVIKIEKDNIVVSRTSLLKEQREKKDARIKEILANDTILEGTVKNIVSYGMFVDIGDLVGLVHYNEISYKGAVNPSKYFKVNDQVNVKVVDYDEKKGHLSLSIKACMNDPWDDITDLIVGDVIEVRVSNMEPYGVFVDLGNDIEGFLHISEISWDKKIKHPKEVLTLDSDIDVEVIEIDNTNKKLRVSFKNLQEKPIDIFCAKYKVKDLAKGIVTEIKDFGAFIKIDGIEGLLANQNCDWDKSKRCKDVLKTGDEVEVKILDINKSASKISLSLKELAESPTAKFASNHSLHDIVTSTVKDKKDFGIFVIVDGFEALIRQDDLHPLNIEEINVGDEIEAVISMLDVNDNRIRLSVRRLERQKDRDALDKYNNQDEKMTFGDILKDKL